MRTSHSDGLTLLNMRFLSVCLIGAIASLFLVACGNKKNKPDIIINEIMTANHAGIVDQDGDISDWIEIKNISKENINLKGYSLVVEKNPTINNDKNNDSNGDDSNNDNDQKATEDAKKESEENNDDTKAGKKKSWDFPQMTIKPGQCLIIFASKKDKSDPKGELHASFKISAKGGSIELQKDGQVVSEVKYGKITDDQCYRRVADNDTAFEATYEQSPGFDNNAQGYEKFNSLIEQQRKSAQLNIWEVQSKGYKDGNTWVEVKNVSNDTVNLKDYSLTNGKKGVNSWQFPEVVLKPGEFFVVDCMKEEFKIGGKKSIMLIKNDKFVDGMWCAAAPFGVSMGRVIGKDGFFFFPTPSRNAENDSSYYRTIAKQPEFKTTAGVYPDKKKIPILINTHGYTVHYTTDGSTPTNESPVYNDTAIAIDETTTIRAYCEGDSSVMFSPTATSTYIFAEKHTIPVMNITVDSADLFDKRRGIYADGPGKGSVFPYEEANFWKKWWKKAHVEFFDSVDGFSEDCEMAIFGGFSRALPKKSFKIRFKDYTGKSEIFCDLYGEGKPSKVKNFVLRSGSQDISGVMVRDEFFTSLMKPNSPDLLVQAYRPVALYVNGSYFGLYYLREKIDKHFAAKHLNVDNDSVTIIMSGMYCDEGVKKDYYDFLAYVKSHDLAEEECYNFVKDNFDITSLADYKLGQIYSCNTDVGNVRFIRSSDPKGDKKWHVVYYDLDATWATTMSASYYLNPGGTAVERAVNLLIAKLLKNEDYRQLFLERASLLIHKTFSSQNATAVFDKLINSIKPEMVRNCERWPGVMKYERWEENVEKFREKFATRDKDMLNDLRKVLEITDEEEKKYFADLGF